MGEAERVFEEWFWPNNHRHTLSMADEPVGASCGSAEENLFGVHYFGDTGRGIIAKKQVEVRLSIPI